MQAVVERHNRLALDGAGRSPLEKFTGIPDDVDPTSFHTFGCPVYILDTPNQSGLGCTPKWEPKYHTGIYLGRSSCHASSIALVLNLSSGLVSPQFHVVYDNTFSTVPYLTSSTPPPNWPTLIESSSHNQPHIDPNTISTWLTPDSITTNGATATATTTPCI